MIRLAFWVALVSLSLARFTPAEELLAYDDWFGERVWTSNSGVELKGKLIGRKGKRLIIDTNGRKPKNVSVGDLSKKDFAIARQLATWGFGTISKPPEVLHIPGARAREGKGKTFATSNFRFTCEDDLRWQWVSDVSRVFEATKNALEKLPLGVDPRGPEEGLLDCKFLSKSAFDAEVRSRKLADESTQGKRRSVVGGFYDGMKDVVIVPVPVAAVDGELKKARSAFKRAKKNDASWLVDPKDVANHQRSVLIHEITHQVMGKDFVTLPTWLLEGVAEYVSALPYASDGRFRAGGWKDALTLRMKESESRTSVQALLRAPAQWPPKSVAAYNGAVAVVGYLLHGDPLADQGIFRTYVEAYRQEWRPVASRMGEYRNAVKAYNASLDGYNKQVEIYNAEITEGNLNAAEPEAPELADVLVQFGTPQALRERQKKVEERLMGIFLRGRTLGQFERDVNAWLSSELGVLE